MEAFFERADAVTGIGSKRVDEMTYRHCRRVGALRSVGRVLLDRRIEDVAKPCQARERGTHWICPGGASERPSERWASLQRYADYALSHRGFRKLLTPRFG